MQCHHQRLLEQVDSIALIRPATRREVYRRISLATDFLHTHYAQDVDLTMLAKMAYLSKYHFLRLFTLVHGMTPRTYLQRKRISVAIRLLESTRMTMSEVVCERWLRRRVDAGAADATLDAAHAAAGSRARAGRPRRLIAREVAPMGGAWHGAHWQFRRDESQLRLHRCSEALLTLQANFGDCGQASA